MLLNIPAVWKASGKAPDCREMASAYAKAAETLTRGSATVIFVSDNGAKAILVLRPLVAAGLT